MTSTVYCSIHFLVSLLVFILAVFVLGLHLTVFPGDLGSLSAMFSMFSLKLLKVFVGRFGTLSLFLSAVLEAFRCFCRPSMKLFAVFAGCFRASCCFSQSFLLFGYWSFFSQIYLAVFPTFCQLFFTLF